MEFGLKATKPKFLGLQKETDRKIPNKNEKKNMLLFNEQENQIQFKGKYYLLNREFFFNEIVTEARKIADRKRLNSERKS